MAGCVLNSGSKGVSKVLSSHSAPPKSKKNFFYQQMDRPTMQQNSLMFPESLPFFCTNKLFQFSFTVYFEERRFRASHIQQI